MRKFLIAGILCAFGSASAAESPPAPSYFAQGNKPGWTLEITPSQLIFLDPRSKKPTVEPHGGAQSNGMVRNFAGPRLKVSITSGPCSIVRGGRRYAERVQLTLAGRKLKGCGGALLPPADLAGTLWRFSHIGGMAVVNPAQTELRFAARQMSGSAGCNRLSGAYIVRDARKRAAASLTVSAVMMTKMACSGPAGQQEQTAMELFGGPLTISFDTDGAMTLTSGNGQSARLVLRP